MQSLFLVGIDCSAKVVYLREDEWLITQQLFKVDVELRREVMVDDIGQNYVVLVPGTAEMYLSVVRVC